MIWVGSFTGRTLDLHALGAVCRQAGILLVVNAFQALGARPIEPDNLRQSTHFPAKAIFAMPSRRAESATEPR